MGFCLFNNVAVTAKWLKLAYQSKGLKKVLILDWFVLSKSHQVPPDPQDQQGCAPWYISSTSVTALPSLLTLYSQRKWNAKGILVRSRRALHLNPQVRQRQLLSRRSFWRSRPMRRWRWSWNVCFRFRYGDALETVLIMLLRLGASTSRGVRAA